MNTRKSSAFTTCLGIATLAAMAMPSIVRAEPNVRLKGDYNFGGIESPDARSKAKAAKPTTPKITITGSISPNSGSVLLNTPIGPVRLDVQKSKPQDVIRFPRLDINSQTNWI